MAGIWILRPMGASPFQLNDTCAIRMDDTWSRQVVRGDRVKSFELKLRRIHFTSESSRLCQNNSVLYFSDKRRMSYE